MEVVGIDGSFVLGLLVVVPLLLWGAINPASMWRTTKGWAYRNPDANEPSDIAYGLQRVASVIGLIVVVVGVGLIVNAGRVQAREEDQVETARRNCAAIRDDLVPMIEVGDTDTFDHEDAVANLDEVQAIADEHGLTVDPFVFNTYDWDVDDEGNLNHEGGVEVRFDLPDGDVLFSHYIVTEPGNHPPISLERDTVC